MRSFSREIWLLSLAAIFFLAQTYFSKPKILDTTFLAPPIELKHMAAGFNSQLADSFWLRAVQDTQYCEKHIAENHCTGKSWFFNIINLVTELDSKFSEAYYFGGLALTALIHDNAGATVIFDRAVVNFKYDWPILYLAAYHALFEENDNSKASKLYLRAADAGAPPWVRLSAGKLAASAGDDSAAIEILEQLIRLESDPRWIDQLKKKLAEKTKNK